MAQPGRQDLGQVHRGPSFFFTTQPAWAKSVMMPKALRSLMFRLAVMSRRRFSLRAPAGACRKASTISVGRGQLTPALLGVG